MARVHAVTSRWIGSKGEARELEELIGRASPEIADFAIHTLGWIRVNQIGEYREVSYDPRSATPRSIAALTALISAGIPSTDAPASALFRLSAYTGRDWLELVDSSVDRLEAFVARTIEFVQPCVVPTALKARLESQEAITEFSGSVQLLFQAAIDAGQRGLNPTDPSIASLLSDAGVGNSESVKILKRVGSGEILFDRYRASGTTIWSSEALNSFPATPVERIVPDRALASNVIHSAEHALAVKRPTIETIEGPVLISRGDINELAWSRLSIPLTGKDHRDRLLVITHRLSAAA